MIRWPFSPEQLRYAVWPLIFALGFGLTTLWAYGAIQTLPDFYDLPIFGRVSTNAISIAAGTFLITFFAMLPFWIPERRGLDLPKRFELAAIFSGGIVALAGAVFLIGEYQDQKQARVTRAWDLLHKATVRATERIKSAESMMFKDGKLTELAKENDNALLKEATGCKVGIRDAFPSVDFSDIDQAVRVVHACAAQGNDGQFGALRTLNEAGISLNDVRLRKLYLARVELPGAELLNADFQGAILGRSNLSGAHAAFADFRYAHLVSANFESAILVRSRLDNALLNGANLRNALLLGAVLNGADLSSSDLSNATLEGASLKGAELERAKLSDAIFCRATMPDGSRCDRNCPDYPSNNCSYLDK